jgi:hypothetical protein
MIKTVKYLVLSLGIILMTPTNSQALEVTSDPWTNAGSQYFNSLTKHSPGSVVPDVVYPFLPSGDILDNILASEARKAPDVGAVEGSIVFLAQTFAGKGTSTGVWLWNLGMITIIGGILLSGFLTFQAVSQGRKGIGEGIVGFLTKMVLCIVLFTFVVPNVPSSLIGLSNIITAEIDNWFVGTPGGGGGNRTDAIEAVFKARMYAAQAAAAATAATMAGTAKQTLKDARGDAVARRFASDPVIRAKVDSNMSAEWNEVRQQFNRITQGGSAGTSGESIKEVNELISEKANTLVTDVMARMTQIIGEEVGNPAASGSPSSTGDQELINQMSAAPQTIDYSKFTYPTRLIQTYTYIAFVYLSLSIWGMGFGALVWVALYALPEEWNMGNLLVSGFKGGIAVILGIVLVTIYVCASVQYTKVEADKGILSTAGEIAAFLGQIVSYNFQGMFMGGGGSPPNVGNFVVNMLSGVTGMTTDQFIMGMLILTAPAQAALIVKGGNGVAESAKNALNNQGASSGSISSMMGNWGGSSGVNQSGLWGSSIQASTQNRSDNIRAGFGPVRRN